MENLLIELATRTTVLVWTETILFAVINVLAFFGNLLTCYAVYRNYRLRTPPNMFVVALAVSDILMSTCCMPFTVTTLFIGRWEFGETICHLQGFGAYTFAIVSLCTMGIIAVSRYFCIVKPGKYQALFTKRKILIYIIVVWCAALPGSAPPFFIEDGRYKFHAGEALCLSRDNITFLSLTYCIYIITPFTVIVVCYIKVCRAVSRSNRVFPQKNSLLNRRVNVKEAKVTKTLIAILFAFSCCWLPVYVMNFVQIHHGEYSLRRQWYLAVGFLLYLSSSINPFIYGIMNRQFRRECRSIVRNFLCLKKSK